MAMSLVMRRIGALGLCTNCCPEVRTLTDIPRGLWPVMSFYAELQQRQDATELLETVRWYVDAAAANYRSLNRQLRHGGRLQKAALGHRQRLDQLAKIAPPLLEPLTLWRGFSSLSFVSYLHHLQKVEDDEDGSQSKDVKDDAYMSCSLSHSIGNFYARRHAILPEDLDDAVLLRIQVPAVCVACCSGLDHEEEILLPRGSVLRIDRIDQLDHKNGPANGQVTAILTAEATLLAGAGANTSLDSRKSLRRVSLYALPPDSAEELTTTLHVADPLDRCDRRERCGENITVDLSTWPIEVLPGLSSAHRAQALPPQTVITNVPFDVPVYSFDEYENPVETGTDVFLMKMTGRDLFQLHIDLMSLRHNNSLSQCPELSPVPGGEIYQLSVAWTKHSAFMRVKGLRPAVKRSSSANGRSRAQPQARPGQRDIPHMLVRLLGDLHIVCGSRHGEGTWLAPDGTKQIPAACMPLQNFCPPLDLNSSFIWAASHGRDPGSVVKLRCQVGLIPSAGDSTLVCGSDGIWRKPIYTLPQPLSEVLSCAPHPNFCSDPSPLLLEGAIAHMSEMHLNATVLVTCAVGYEPSGGEDMGLCGIHPEDDSRGRWVSPSSISKGQVPWKPLRCRLKQSYCPTIQMSHGMLLSLSKERFLQSQAHVGCAEGYAPAGGFDAFTCEASTSLTGEWRASDGISDLSQKLQCSKVVEYCPVPVPPEGTYFVMSAGLEMDSEVAQLDDEELERLVLKHGNKVRSLKDYCKSLFGTSVYKQRLLKNGEILSDNHALTVKYQSQLQTRTSLLEDIAPWLEDLALGLEDSAGSAPFSTPGHVFHLTTLGSSRQRRPSQLAGLAADNHQVEIMRILLQAMAHVNQTDEEGRSPLWIASQHSQLDAVVCLLEAAADVDQTDHAGQTPLYRATSHQHSSTVLKLLEAKASANKCCHETSPLWIACQSGNSKIVQLLLSVGADKNKLDAQGRSPLWSACGARLETDNVNTSFGDHLEAVRLLLEASAHCDTPDEKGRSPLLLACERGRLKAVGLLLTARATISQRDHDGQSPLLVACQAGHFDVAHFLLSESADHSQMSKRGETALILAVKHGHLDLVRVLLEARADFDRPDINGKSPLFTACQYGHAAVSSVLLSAGAEKDAADGETPTWIASRSGHADVLRILLAAAADVNQAAQGVSPLWMASRAGHVESVEVLLQLADKERADCDGKTPLWIACCAGHAEIVRVLLDASCRLEADRSGRTPLAVASEFGHVDIVRLLTRRRREQDWKEEVSEASPLMAAAREGHHAVVVALLEAGEDVNQVDRKRRSPLWMACQSGHLQVVRCLLKAFAGLDQATYEEETPLFTAALQGHSDVLNTLLEAKAQKDKTNKDGKSPLWISCRLGHMNVLDALLEHTACDAAKELDQPENQGRAPLWIAARVGHHRAVQSLLNAKAEKDTVDLAGKTALLVSSRFGHKDVVNALLQAKAHQDPAGP
ncbi:unnamed protein product [Durusdinium trenchii]|uniref:Sushi domain-containing protein n=1 Tax=Durusdinium trenchii TaxID=1381693 RepID=A0ABP0I1R9_9DINO